MPAVAPRYDPVMAEETWNLLMRFDREALTPQIDQLRREMYTQFDGVYKRLERIDDELVSINGSIRRVEDRVTAVERR
jgi:hypothetical protein